MIYWIRSAKSDSYPYVKQHESKRDDRGAFNAINSRWIGQNHVNMTVSAEAENQSVVPSNLITSIVINSIDNQPIDGVSIYLFQGLRKFDNSIIRIEEKTNKNIDLDKSPLSDPSLIIKTTSDMKGNFGFYQLGPNKYTLLVEKEGFYRETISIITII